MNSIVAAVTTSPNSWATNKDLLALTVSALALMVSIVTSRQNVKATRKIAENSALNNEELARDATYQRIHEALVDQKAAAGRRLLFQADRDRQFPSIGEPGWDEINYALALYDTLGGYVERGQVDSNVVLAAWHHPLVNITVPIQNFMTHRQEQDIQQPWSFLIKLINSAHTYTCTCSLKEHLTSTSTSSSTTESTAHPFV